MNKRHIVANLMSQKGLKLDHSIGQEVAKRSNAKSYAKSDFRYWLPRVFKNSYTGSGGRKETTDFCVRLARKGRRETFNLESPNQATAAKKAQCIYLSLVAKGWDETLAEFKPRAVISTTQATVGALIASCTRLSSSRPESLDTYAKALRRIAAGVCGISDGRKHDAFKGGHAEWIEKVNAIPLVDLTPARVLEWKNRLLKSCRTPEARRRASVTVNSLVRNARALLSKKVRPFITEEMELPSPLFFEGITAEPEPSLRYRSSINAEAMLQIARIELSPENPEAFKLLLLTLVCGLRRSEADTLMWQQFDFENRVLVVTDNPYKRLKSEDSAGDIDLDPEVCELFKRFRENAEGEFVLEATGDAEANSKRDRKYRCYRCEGTHQSLLAWLREQGVKSLRPIHTLRKEIGSIIASREGIWKASRYLRHSDISITSKLYADKKTPVRAGMGGVLK